MLHTVLYIFTLTNIMRHLDARKVVCIGCFSKCQRYTIDSSDTLKDRVDKHILKDLNINDRK